MKVAIISESPADVAALRVITDAIAGAGVEHVEHRLALRPGGYTEAFKCLSIVLRAIHYEQSAEALVFVVDSDRTPVHEPAHDHTRQDVRTCRFCYAKHEVVTQQNDLRPIPGRNPVVVAIGLAVPAMEAWLLLGVNPHVGEAQWKRGLAERRLPYEVKELKQQLYGTADPRLEAETKTMVEAAGRVAKNLEGLKQWFPDGFGPLADTLRALSRQENPPA